MRTPSTNHGWGAPNGREASIRLLPVEIARQPHGEVHYSTWQLDAGERAAIAAGANIRLGVTWIGGMPPVSMSLSSEPVLE